MATKKATTKTEATRRRKSKGKRHPVHAESLDNIADQLNDHASRPDVDLSTPRAMLRLFADVLSNESKRVRGILR